MIRRIFMVLAAGLFAATIPGMALANPANPYWSKERVQTPGPFTVETARALGESSHAGKSDMRPAGEPIGAAATPSGERGEKQGCEKPPGK